MLLLLYGVLLLLLLQDLVGRAVKDTGVLMAASGLWYGLQVRLPCGLAAQISHAT